MMASIASGAAAAKTVGADPRVIQWSSHFQNANEGPATIAAKISGVNTGGKREDDAPYFTNNEGIPFPDPAHSKTVGGLPLVSDTFLLQKQQTFNRSKNLERMVHPCKSFDMLGLRPTNNSQVVVVPSATSRPPRTCPVLPRLVS